MDIDFDDERPKKPKTKRSKVPAPMRDAERRTPMSPESPAPRFAELLSDRGPELTERALAAWSARVEGVPIVDIAHQMGVSIVLCKKLISEVHEAIRDDLKDTLELNRQLDLERIDGLLHSFYPMARQGDTDAAAITIRALQHRSKLTGIEPLPNPTQNHPTNVLNWITLQMPNIHKLVDSLPHEMPPNAPDART